MRKIRVFYKKIERAKYLSHLDLMRSMMRGLKMSGLEVKYTQGYNPRIYLTFALPLSLGYEGERESMDFDLLDEEITLLEIKNKLIRVMPESIPIIEVGLVEKDAKSITYGDYLMTYSPKDFLEDIPTHEKLWKVLLEKEEILVEKKSKRKINTIDIKPEILSIEITNNQKDMIIKTRLPAGITKNINPRLILKSFEKENDRKINAGIKRVAILDENQEIFR